MSRQPIRVDDPKLARILREIYDRLEALERRHEGSVGQPKQTSGKPGDTRIVQMADNTFELQVRSKEGWRSSGALAFQTKE